MCIRDRCRRSKGAASTLVVAQQCGGSDAFSGTAANPLLADASKMLVEAGGSALLAETESVRETVRALFERYFEETAEAPS